MSFSDEDEKIRAVTPALNQSWGRNKCKSAPLLKEKPAKKSEVSFEVLVPRKQESYTSNEGNSYECDDVWKRQSLILNKGNPQRLLKRQKCPDDVQREKALDQKMMPQDLKRGKAPKKSRNASKSSKKVQLKILLG